MPTIHDAFPAILLCDTLVFRALRPGWISEDHVIHSQAFTLRPNENGLSVNNNCENATRSLKSLKAVTSLHVGKVRDAKADVIPDRRDHAEITGLPDLSDDAETERMATALLRNARLAWHRLRSTN